LPLCQILFSKSLHDSTYSRKTSSVARHYLMSGSFWDTVVKSKSSASPKIYGNLTEVHNHLGHHVQSEMMNANFRIIRIIQKIKPTLIHEPPGWRKILKLWKLLQWISELMNDVINIMRFTVWKWLFRICHEQFLLLPQILFLPPEDHLLRPAAHSDSLLFYPSVVPRL